MKSVRKIIKKRLPPYNFRSRKSAVKRVNSSTPKVNREVQASLSEEENCTLLCQLPYHPSSLEESTGVLNLSEESQPNQPRDQPRYSTAFSEPNQANHTNCEAVDISLDPNDDWSIAQPSSSNQIIPDGPREDSGSSSLEDFTPIDSRILRSGPRIALEVEETSEPSSEKPSSPIQDQETSTANKEEQLINSQILPYSEVADRINYKKQKHNKKIIRSESLSRSDFSYTQTDSEREYTEDSKEENIERLNSDTRRRREKQITETHNQNTELAAMDAATLRELQDQMNNLQTQMRLQHRVQQQTATALEQVPLPEIVNTRRPPPFHGYDSEDVNRWLDKVENYLKLRRIDLATPTAQAELVTSLAGPAEDFYYSLPIDRKATYVDLRDSLRERFANDNQSWIIWQAVSTRQQGEKESLDTYLSDLTNKFRRLIISDTEKMRYFVQGLRPEIRETVLLRQPKSFREAEEIARLTCAVKSAMISPVIDVPHQLSYSTGNTSNQVLLAKVEELRKKLEKYKQPTKTDVTLTSETSAKVSPPTNVAYLDGQPEVALLNDSPSCGSIRELHHLREKIEQLSHEWDAKLRILSETQPYGYYNDDRMARIAAFFEPRRETPVLIRKLHRIENKFQELSRRVDARFNGLIRKNFSNRDEPPRQRTREEQRSQKTRRGRPICYKCGRVGHLQYSCYNYNQPEEQYQDQEGNTNRSLETDQEANVSRPNREVTLAVTSEQQPQTLPNREQSSNRKRRELSQIVQSSNVLLLRERDADLKSSDLTTEGKIADQSVQLLVDTGACVSAIDQQFFTNIYGQFPPKMSEGSLTSVQTVSGDTVPVLGKITIPVLLNGLEYPCEFHVMQNLAYDAILGRNFLQDNGALIDLVNNTLSFEGATHPRKQSTNTTTVPVMGTFLPQLQNLEEKKTEATQGAPAPSPTSVESKLVHRSARDKEMIFHWPLLGLMFIILYLLTASCTPPTKDSAKPVIQSFVHKTPDFKVEDVQVADMSARQANCKEFDQSILHETEAERMALPKSGDTEKMLKSDYSSHLTVDQDLQKEDEKRDNLYDIIAPRGNEVPRY